MHLPWKKKPKFSRISQLVAGLQSPKQGKTLVVETGFPTSLVDLFVKNRDRLKNSSSKTKNDDHIEISSPIVLESTKKCVNEAETVRQRNGEVIDEVRAFELSEKGRKRDSEVFNDWLQSKNVLVWGLKMFFSAILLGLCTRKFAVVISLSTFALMFIEYVERRLELSYGVNLRLKSLVTRIGLCILRFRNDVLVSISREDKGVASELYSVELKSSVGEIEVADSGSEKVDPICAKEVASLENRLERKSQAVLLKDCLEWESKLESAEEAEDLELKNKHKASPKRKSKSIKKFMMKKLQRGKKKNKGKPIGNSGEEQVSGNFKDEDSVSSYEHTEKQGKREEREQDNGNGNLALSSRELVIYAEQTEQREITGPRSSNRREGQISPLPEEVDIQRKRNSNYLVLLLVILAGLLGGRMIAFVITIACCFMLKLVCKSRESTAATMMESTAYIPG